MLHITGPAMYETVTKGYATLESMAAAPYVDDMAEAYRGARLALMRAGASTAAELTALGLPALLVPYPAARDDHQTANARVLQKAGAAEMCFEEYLSPSRLAEHVIALWGDTPRLDEMNRAMRSLGRPGAGGEIAEAILNIRTEGAR
jgi:UDP-N-acetylglucosamine--N-acetylmuramyl-(pentapeptide) pyrophosphoryl-undecaprenol N-acetylglucosamine transferase